MKIRSVLFVLLWAFTAAAQTKVTVTADKTTSVVVAPTNLTVTGSLSLTNEASDQLLMLQGKKIKPVGTTTVRGINKVVHIAYRTDGRIGTGTAEDPFDGSTTTKFDTQFTAAVQESCEIVLGPGTFTTAGKAFPAFSFPLEYNTYLIRGAGIGLTTIKLAAGTVTAAGTHYVIGQHHNSVPVDQTPAHVEISNLTIDANYGQQLAATNGTANVVIIGLHIGAQRAYLHDLHIKGAYGKTLESVGASIGSPMVTNCWGVIERVIVTDCSGYVTGLNLIGGNDTNRVSGLIKDCYVQGDNTKTAGQSQNGMGGWYLDGVTFANNRAERLYTGFVVDAHNNKNVTFNGNSVTNAEQGIVFNGSGNYEGLYILNNTLQTIGNSLYGGPMLSQTNHWPLVIFNNLIDNPYPENYTNVVTTTNVMQLAGLTNYVQGQLNAKLNSALALASAGSVSAPVYSFTDDPDTGMYRQGANSIGFAAAGALSLQVSSTGVYPLLSVYNTSGSTANPSYSFSGNSTSGLSLGDDTSAVVVSANGSPKIYVAATNTQFRGPVHYAAKTLSYTGGTNVIVDLSLGTGNGGSVFLLNVTNTTHIHFTNFPPVSVMNAGSIQLLVDATGGYSITVNTNQGKFPSNTLPSFSTNANAVDVISFITDYHGSNALLNASIRHR